MKLAFASILAASGICISAAEATPVVRTIAGSRLTIAIGDDTSLQVWDSTVGRGLALLAPNCADSGQTGDAGTLVAIGGSTFGPDFASHPCGTNTPAALATAWTPVSISPVTVQRPGLAVPARPGFVRFRVPLMRTRAEAPQSGSTLAILKGRTQ